MRCAVPLAVLFVLLVPAASAHNTVPTDDGAYFLTVGHLNEPATTFMQSGLDLSVRVNESGERGAEVPDLHQTLSATLIAPDGTEMESGLRVQHGSVGRYSFENPYYLTQPGQYRLRLVGTIGETMVDGVYDVSGPMQDKRDLWFPDEDVPTGLELQQQAAALQTEVDALEAQVQVLESRIDAMETAGGGSTTEQGAPGPGGLFVLLAIVGAALVFARRR